MSSSIFVPPRGVDESLPPPVVKQCWRPNKWAGGGANELSFARGDNSSFQFRRQQERQQQKQHQQYRYHDYESQSSYALAGQQSQEQYGHDEGDHAYQAYMQLQQRLGVGLTFINTKANVDGIDFDLVGLPPSKRRVDKAVPATTNDNVYEKELANSVAIAETSNNKKAAEYPVISLNHEGIISISLSEKEDVVVEMNAETRSLRLVVDGRFACSCSGSGESAAVMHPKAMIWQKGSLVLTTFEQNKECLFGEESAIFTMSGLDYFYLVSSSEPRGTSAIPKNCLMYPSDFKITSDAAGDFTADLLYGQHGRDRSLSKRQQASAKRLVMEATRNDHNGKVIVQIGDVRVGRERDGRVHISCKPTFVKYTPNRAGLVVKTATVEIGVDGSASKAYVKQSAKQCHVSRSGIVVTNAMEMATMDKYGRMTAFT